MIGWLLDTNVLSEMRRPKPNADVLRFISERPLDQLYTSVATFAEIRFGIERLTDVARRAALHEWLEHIVRPMFEGRLLEIDEEIMLRWRLILDDGRKRGHTFSQPDLLIAATALHHGLTVVTRDTREYAMANVPVLNPWT